MLNAGLIGTSPIARPIERARRPSNRLTRSGEPVSCMALNSPSTSSDIRLQVAKRIVLPGRSISEPVSDSAHGVIVSQVAIVMLPIGMPVAVTLHNPKLND